MTTAQPKDSKRDFETLLAPVLEPAYRTAYHFTRNREDAEELVQESALLAFKGFHRFQAGSNFKAWFLTILRNRFISDYRKQKRTVATIDLEDAQDIYIYTKSRENGLDTSTADPARKIVGSLDSEQVATALAELPDEFREACTLYFTQDLAYQDIAAVLGVPVGTVRSRIHRGRKHLQQRLWSLAQDYGIVQSGE